MATALEIISRAMRQCGALGVGEIVSSDDSALGLEALNAMLDSWQIERLLVYRLKDQTFPLVSGTASYTCGFGGTWSTTNRPVKIESACVVDASGNVFPCTQIDKQTLDAIDAPYERSTYPTVFYVDWNLPLVRFTLYPTPGNSSVSFRYTDWQPMQQFVAPPDVFSFPPGYLDAVTFNLAIRLAVEFGLPVTAELNSLAMSTKARVKKINLPDPVMQTDLSWSRYAYG